MGVFGGLELEIKRTWVFGAGGMNVRLYECIDKDYVGARGDERYPSIALSYRES